MPTKKELANALRFLAVDAVERAKSGHPGAPLGMADMAEVLWRDFLKHNPNNPQWSNRDRFVLSNGHASMLLYALLHLSGYDLSLEDLQKFRQLKSKTPGHPEYGITPGVETTTGPLGQGVAMAVGMAIAEKNLAAKFNRPGYPVVDHYTYVFLGDGCLMEGISHEACSLAGTLKLNKLICLWDDNGISIDGKLSSWFSDNTPQRFRAYGWQVIEGIDGHDAAAVQAAIAQAKLSTTQPTLICCKTKIGYGSPNFADTAKVHGSPLGSNEAKLVREQLDWPYPEFHIPAEIAAAWDARQQGATAETAWNALFAQYAQEYPEMAAEFTRRIQHELPAEWLQASQALPLTFQNQAESIATRNSSKASLSAWADKLPELFGGSADLSESNGTFWKTASPINADGFDWQGNYLHYGVREFAMTAIGVGIKLHGGFIPFVGTFLVFSDYARNAIRLAALMEVPLILIYTHDSIGLGEDGPTHQPVEQLLSLRAIPNLINWRPCDSVEVAVAWQLAIAESAKKSKRRPHTLVLSRQNLACQPRTAEALANVAKGGYVLKESEGDLELILIATGSEVELVMQAAKVLAERGYGVRVVSMPSVELFAEQNMQYREAVLPRRVKRRIVVEAGSTLGWHQYVGSEGAIIGLDRFGESGQGAQVFKYFGFSVEHILEVAENLLTQKVEI